MNLSGLHRKFVLNGRDTMDPTKVTGPTQLLSLGYLWQSVPGIDTDGTSTANANEGHQTWMYIQASVAISQWDLVEQRTTATDVLGVPSLAGTPPVAGRVLGVAQYDIAAGEYGFVMCYGITKVNVDAGFPLIVDQVVLASGAGADGEVVGTATPNGADATKTIGYCISLPETIKITLFRG
tara:strand:+ start:424 stop:966 length:543 start_codon:yes stop_codon:yes gene_type:complete